MHDEKGKVVTSLFRPLFKERGVDCRMHGGCRSRESTRLTGNTFKLDALFSFQSYLPNSVHGSMCRVEDAQGWISAAVVYQGANRIGPPAQANSVKVFPRAFVTREMCKIVIPSQQRRRENGLSFCCEFSRDEITGLPSAFHPSRTRANTRRVHISTCTRRCPLFRGLPLDTTTLPVKT